MLVGSVRVIGRILRGLIAAAALIALVAGLPWALWHYIGWPLPDHIPSWDEVEATLLSPMSVQFLLDMLACLCWITWFFFTIDVARCTVNTAYDVARGIALREFRPAGPLRGLATALVGAVVLTLLGNRTPTSLPATARVLTTDLAPVAVTAPLDPGSEQQPAVATQQHGTTTLDWSAPALPGTVKAVEEVRLPHAEGGTLVYDSLWRIAERMFGDGNRWPELYELNRGITQPDGRTLTQPHLVHPGWKISGYIPAPSTEQPPDEQQPPVPPTQPPKTTTPPTSTTQPTPNTTQASATSPETADDGREQDTTGQPGLDLLTGAFVSVILAGVISAAVVSGRMWHRRRYRIGSGDRFDLHRPTAPVVRALRAAHDDNESSHTDPDDVEVVEPTPTPPVDVHVTETGAVEPNAEPVFARIGVRGGRELALNLASTRGLGVVGPGATAAARALMLHVLAQGVQDGEPVRILLLAPDLPLIFGTDTPRLPSSVGVVDSLDSALDEMEAELVTRTRHLGDKTTSGRSVGTLVLLGSPAAHAERRLQAVLDHGATLGMAGILFGQWRPGATVRVRPDGTISATSPGLGDSLAGTRLFTLPTSDITQLLAVLREAEGTADHEPTSVETADDLTRLELTEPQEHTEAEPAQHLQPPPIEIQETERVPKESPFPPLTLRVLGRVELILHDEEPERDLAAALTRKQREVLVYLALHPNGAHRDAINDAVWPDSPISRPFNSFHNALSLMRRALHQATDGRISEIIRHDDSRYQLDTSIVTTDYGRFHTALTTHVSATDHERINALHQAVAVCRGHLAEDVTSHWIESYREATRRDALDALDILIRTHADANPTTRLALLEKMRTLDRYNEGIYRDIIRTQFQFGQHDAIARTLALLTTALDELGQHPSQKTINLAESLQRRGTMSCLPTAGGVAG